MAIPSYDRFVEPILRFLADRPQGAPAREAHEAAADALGIDEQDRRMLLPSGSQAVFRNRAGWAHDRLKRAGLSESPRRGVWKLTVEGRKFVEAHPGPLSVDEVERLALAFIDVRLRTSPEAPAATALLPSQMEAPEIASPDDRLARALDELRRACVEELLDALHSVSPAFFETIVLDLLHRMGYGASRADLQRVGGAGDGGIDGIISLDKLGLEKVYVQAKRWKNPVGAPEIQAFYGALAGQRANKGVFITTSSYTAQAAAFARSLDRIVLVDGVRMADLMIEHDLGVSVRIARIPKLDGDYFDEGSS